MESSENTVSAISRFQVFVPGAFPQYSYVRRVFKSPRTGEEFDPESRIREALSQPGIIAQIVGPSKSGKTRAVENCVGTENLVAVAGAQISEANPIWDIVLRVMKAPVSSEHSAGDCVSVSGDVELTASADFSIVSAEAKLSSGVERAREVEEIITYSADPFTTATSALLASGRVLFLDDFHTIPESMQSLVAAQLKAAAQLGVKICLAEVPHHSDSTISALPDLTGRVQKIEFQYWSVEDLLQIGVSGFGQLNAELTNASLTAFAVEAAGSPQLMQLICLNAAARLNVNFALDERQTFQILHDDIRVILIKTHESVDREKIFGILDRGPEERGSHRNRYPVKVLGTGDNYEIALAAISLNPPVTSLTWSGGSDNLAVRIDKVCSMPAQKPAKGQITRALEQMQVLAEMHMPRQPIIEWNAATGLHILDPYFLFHLRWSEKYEKIRATL